MVTRHFGWSFGYSVQLLCLAIVLLFCSSICHAQTSTTEKLSRPQVTLLQIDGAIGPAVADYVSKGFAAAREKKASLVVLQMDTPGGLDNAMRDIIKEILGSEIPVVSYVAPSGSRAASAGTYILYGSHLAAMAPATNLGAATPIKIGGLPGMPEPAGEKKEGKKKEDKDKKEESSKEKNDKPVIKDAMQKKMINDAAAYIKSLAARNGRNEQWAEQAVREAVSLTAEEALAKNVINVIAVDVDDLLRQVDGKTVRLEDRETTIRAAAGVVQTFKPDWRNKLLMTLTDPNIAYIFMLLGMYGLIFELANPGYVLPGVIGGICLLLALYSFQILPINYTGLALVLLGIVFMISEVFVPSFGSLGIGGVIAFVIGSFILVDEQSMRISLPLIFSTAAISLVGILWVVGSLVAIRKKRFRTGSEALVGSVGEVAEDFEHEGRVWIQGESWLAKSGLALQKGEMVKVTGQKGLELEVTKCK